MLLPNINQLQLCWPWSINISEVPHFKNRADGILEPSHFKLQRSLVIPPANMKNCFRHGAETKEKETQSGDKDMVMSSRTESAWEHISQQFPLVVSYCKCNFVTVDNVEIILVFYQSNIPSVMWRDCQTARKINEHVGHWIPLWFTI